MGKRIEIYRVPVKEHERTYVRIVDEPEYEERQRRDPMWDFEENFRRMGFPVRRRRCY